ncbi:MAG: hypothetical protein AAF348_11565 [Bacteroidota bacterium]
MDTEALKSSLPNLHSAAVSETELMDRAIDYTRPLGEYPTISDIIDHLSLGERPRHIYTDSLNKGGVAVQDSMESYLSNPSLSSGMLKESLKTPLHLAFALEGDKKELEKLQGEKAHFNLGNYLHQAILEPTKFSRAIVEPKYSLASKEGVKVGIDFWEREIESRKEGVNEKGEAITSQEVFDLAIKDVTDLGLDIEKQDGKKTYLKALKCFSGLEAVTEENYLKIQILKNHYEEYGGGILKRLLLHSKREISLYGKDETTGLDVKVRPDALQFKENIGVDAVISVKSSGIEDLRAFYYQAAKLHYDLSEGMYQQVATQVTGRDFNTTITVMLQTVAPFAVAVMVWSPEDIETGKYKYRTALEITKRAFDSNEFPGYDSFSESGDFGLIQMHLPQWNNQEFLPNN